MTGHSGIITMADGRKAQKMHLVNLIRGSLTIDYHLPNIATLEEIRKRLHSKGYKISKLTLRAIIDRDILDRIYSTYFITKVRRGVTVFYYREFRYLPKGCERILKTSISSTLVAKKENLAGMRDIINGKSRQPACL